MNKLPLSLSLMLFLLFSLSCQAGTKDSSRPQPKPKPLVTLVELGSVSCIPCKLMQPVLEAVRQEYGDTVAVVFYDLGKHREMGSKYKVRVMPTQVFLDKRGKEFYRHEGFFPLEEVQKVVDKKLGFKRPLSQPKTQ